MRNNLALNGRMKLHFFIFAVDYSEQTKKRTTYSTKKLILKTA